MEPPILKEINVHYKGTKQEKSFSQRFIDTIDTVGDYDDNGKPIAKWRKIYARLTVIWVVFSYSWLLIQVESIYSSKDATGISTPAYIVYVFSSWVWFIYGTFVLPRRNAVIMTSSTLAIILGTLTLIGSLVYKNDRNMNAEERIDFDKTWKSRMYVPLS